MRRLINFSLGLIVGSIISTVIVLLITPQSAEAMTALFKEAYKNKKTDLEAELGFEATDD